MIYHTWRIADLRGRRWGQWLVIGLLCVCLAGCGYRFGGGDGVSSALKGKTISVPVFANKTFRPNLETALTSSLREEIALRSGGRIAESDSADLVLTGAVVSLVTVPVSYDRDDRIREYRSTLVVDATLRDRATGEIRWKGSRTASQEYPVIEFPLRNQPVAERVSPSTKIGVQQNSEEAALREICRKLARDVYEKMNEGF